MKPQPQSIHENGATKKSMETIRREEIRTVSSVLLALLLSPLLYYLFFDLPPKFSVQLTAAQGLDMAAAPGTPLSTLFNATLRASNRRGSYRCYRHGEAVVRYAGFTLGWGRTRAFCVGAKDARDVPVVAWADGVTLPKSLHDRMAAQRRMGSVELEVQVRLFEDDDSSGSKPTGMWCKAKTGGAEPSDMTPCTVFSTQNWASDFVPNWMQ